MRRALLILAVLAGCPAPQAPPPEEPPPPPPAVVAIDAPPAPDVPAVIAVRSGRDRLEVIRLDASGEQVLHELERASALPRVADLAVDPASGRYAILVETDTVDDVAVKAPRNTMALVLGTIGGETVAAGPGAKKCVMHKCFESEVAIAPGGDAVVTTLHRSKSSDLVQYAFAAAPSPTPLTTKGVEQPALSPDLQRVAFVRGNDLHVTDVGAKPSTPAAKGVKDVVALVLGDDRLAYRTGGGAVGIVEVAGGATMKAPALAADPRPALRIAGDLVLTTDGGSVVAIAVDGGAWRAITTGALIDVTADGAWVLVDDGALKVVATADGQVWASHDVPAAFGEVRARLIASRP